MENASKALLIAGGILLAILMISLMVYAWGKISEYQASKVELANIKSTAEFNAQFTNYDRDDVQGYELLTLIHRVIDYNQRNTKDSTINADSYPCISLTISMETYEDNVDKRTDLTYDNISRLFKSTTYTDNELSAENRNKPTSFEYGIESKINDAMTTLLR